MGMAQSKTFDLFIFPFLGILEMYVSLIQLVECGTI